MQAPDSRVRIQSSSRTRVGIHHSSILHSTTKILIHEQAYRFPENSLYNRRYRNPKTFLSLLRLPSQAPTNISLNACCGHSSSTALQRDRAFLQPIQKRFPLLNSCWHRLVRLSYRLRRWQLFEGLRWSRPDRASMANRLIVRNTCTRPFCVYPAGWYSWRWCRHGTDGIRREGQYIYAEQNGIFNDRTIQNSISFQSFGVPDLGSGTDRTEIDPPIKMLIC